MVSVAQAMKWFTPDKNKTGSQAPPESLLRSLKRRSLRLKRPKPPNLQEKRKSGRPNFCFLFFFFYKKKEKKMIYSH